MWLWVVVDNVLVIFFIIFVIIFIVIVTVRALLRNGFVPVISLVSAFFLVLGA
jgi:hypothetical protein